MPGLIDGRRGQGMPQHIHVVRVLNASLGDVSEERALISPLITECNSGAHRQAMLTPITWGHAGAGATEFTGK